MTRYTFVSMFLGLAIGLVVVVPTAMADTDMSAEKQTIITQTCVSSQTVLQRIQHNDAATRVNRGQGFETLITRLMTPLNTRTTARGFNESAALLLDTSKRYQQTLENFKDTYEAYDNALTGALRTKCKDKPAKFYEYIEQARKHRQNLAGEVATLHHLAGEYRANVQKLTSEVAND